VEWEDTAQAHCTAIKGGGKGSKEKQLWCVVSRCVDSGGGNTQEWNGGSYRGGSVISISSDKIAENVEEKVSVG